MSLSGAPTGRSEEPDAQRAQPRPPDTWPGAGGRRSVAPGAPGGQHVQRAGDPGSSWPGAAATPLHHIDPPPTGQPAGSGPPAPAPAEPVQLREPAQQVSPKAKQVWRLSAALSAVPPLGALATWMALSPGQRRLQIPLLAVLLALAAAYLVVMPAWRFRVHRWEVTDIAVYTQSGWLQQERRIAPISRIQTVDSEYGPLERLFGLGSLTVTTASAAGPLRVAGLERGVVERLVTDLTRITARTEGDAT